MVMMMAVAGLIGSGCGRSSSDDSAGHSRTPVAGRPIESGSSKTNEGPLATRGQQSPPASPGAGLSISTNTLPDGTLDLRFDSLAAFPYRVYEYYAEGVAGRPLLKSDDTIPDAVRALDGRRVSLRGFVLALRTRQGRVTEFLLLKDQGTCCFGAQAQINHFIRVTFPGGRTFESGLPYRVKGRLKVGETYVQGYLTGIYQLQAEAVDEAP